jgi:hypothetical protein
MSKAVLRPDNRLSAIGYRLSTIVPLVAAALMFVALTIGYRYADVTRHRRPPLAPPSPPLRAATTWPGTTLLTGTLTSYSQRVMSLRTEQGLFAIILALSTDVVPTCRGYPTLQRGERLEVRTPSREDGSLLAAMVKDARPCPPGP